MEEITSCKASIENCLRTRTFSVAHLYKEEKTMDMHIHDCYELYYSISGGKQFLIDNRFYIIGRKDFSEILRGNPRQSMNELLQNLNKEKFSIILDHQPNDYNNQTDAEADLVLSGHTHGGQLFPLNKVGEWIGANDKTYGYEKRKQTNFIVTSGLSDWAIKFKTGTKSEFVVIDIKHNNSP